MSDDATDHPAPAGTLLGAYATAPGDEDATAFRDGIRGLAIGGLEVPLPAAGTAPADFAPGPLEDGWDLMVTCIPTVMGRLGQSPGYGLASSDDDARALALSDVAIACDLARRLADASGRRRVVAIEVQSAPGPRGGSADALHRSLETVAAWDTAGADVLVEHCDARLPGQEPAKGFLRLDQELAVLLALGAGSPDGARPRLGTAINWGRSAIEGRSATAPLEHIAAAREAGMLRALVLSGAAAVETPWGPAWADAHIPPRGHLPALDTARDSLLGPSEVAAALRAAGPACRVAVKVAARPRDADVATRLAVASASLDLVHAAQGALAEDAS